MAALRKWGPWAALVIIAVVVLAIGLQRSSSPSLDARVQSIASQVRCPVCNGETVAQSSAAPSVEIRDQIRSELLAGRTRSQVLAGLVQAYGAGILEKPQASGIGLVVWVVPVIAVVAAAGVLVLVLRRWKVRAGAPASTTAASGEETGPSSAGAGTAVPLGAEAAGTGLAGAAVATGLAAGGGAVPSAATSVAVAEAVEAVAPETGSDPATPEAEPVEPAGGRRPGRRRPGRPGSVGGEPARPAWSRRTRLAVGGLGAVIVASGASWAAVAALHKSLPGQSITGQALPAEQVAAHLQAATADAAKNDVVNAVKEYEKVLKAQPDQVQALTGMGWILAQTGQPSLLKQGLTQMESAEQIDPTYAPAHLYRGMALLGEGNYAASVPELQWYLDHNPDPQLTDQVKSALAKAKAGQAAASAGSSGASAPGR